METNSHAVINIYCEQHLHMGYIYTCIIQVDNVPVSVYLEELYSVSFSPLTTYLFALLQYYSPLYLVYDTILCGRYNVRCQLPFRNIWCHSFIDGARFNHRSLLFISVLCFLTASFLSILIYDFVLPTLLLCLFSIKTETDKDFAIVLFRPFVSQGLSEREYSL